MAAALTFDPATHSYRIDGVDVPSVTKVLESVGLIDYSHITLETRRMALERGRAVHEAIALDLEGDLDEESARQAGVIGYVEAARAARRALGIDKPDAWEHMAYHSHFRFAGTIDLICGKLIVDWKTEQAEYWVRFQLAAYASLLGKTSFAGASFRRVAAELHQDGSYRLIELPKSEWLDDFRTFLAALRVHQEKTRRRELR